MRDLVGSQTIVLAAGGIADGRGLAASLMLGADGAARNALWASIEAQGSDVAKAAITDAKGDNTVRSKVFDVLRGVDWHYTGRVVRNAVLEWHESIENLKKNSTTAKAAYDASDADDLSTRVLIAGEAVDLIKSVKSAESIVQEMSLEAEALIGSASAHLIAAESIHAAVPECGARGEFGQRADCSSSHLTLRHSDRTRSLHAIFGQCPLQSACGALISSSVHRKMPGAVEMYELLKGMRLVEGSAFIAAPLGGMALAQLGADVIRFDDVQGGIDYGRWPLAASGRSIYWASMNKGKRSFP